MNTGSESCSCSELNIWQVRDSNRSKDKRTENNGLADSTTSPTCSSARPSAAGPLLRRSHSLRMPSERRMKVKEERTDRRGRAREEEEEEGEDDEEGNNGTLRRGDSGSCTCCRCDYGHASEFKKMNHDDYDDDEGFTKGKRFSFRRSKSLRVNREKFPKYTEYYQQQNMNRNEYEQPSGNQSPTNGGNSKKSSILTRFLVLWGIGSKAKATKSKGSKHAVSKKSQTLPRESTISSRTRTGRVDQRQSECTASDKGSCTCEKKLNEDQITVRSQVKDTKEKNGHVKEVNSKQMTVMTKSGPQSPSRKLAYSSAINSSQQLWSCPLCASGSPCPQNIASSNLLVANHHQSLGLQHYNGYSSHSAHPVCSVNGMCCVPIDANCPLCIASLTYPCSCPPPYYGMPCPSSYGGQGGQYPPISGLHANNKPIAFPYNHLPCGRESTSIRQSYNHTPCCSVPASIDPVCCQSADLINNKCQISSSTVSTPKSSRTSTPVKLSGPKPKTTFETRITVSNVLKHETPPPKQQVQQPTYIRSPSLSNNKIGAIQALGHVSPKTSKQLDSTNVQVSVNTREDDPVNRLSSVRDRLAKAKAAFLETGPPSSKPPPIIAAK
ncbi:hypothetical protein HDE_07286 [Halotydeus destructor]|nr:hypothetical protein HDE_07286 [Halotydeus destructor]